MQKQKKCWTRVVMIFSSIFFPALAMAETAGWSTGNYSGYGLPSGTIYAIILGVMKWSLGIFGFIAIIGFVISGLLYLTSAGDDDQQEKAKKQMTWSIIGVIVGLVGYVIIVAVNSMLGGSSTTF